MHELAAVWYVCGTNCVPGLYPIKIEGGGACPDLPLCDGAGEGNRTVMTSLEGRRRHRLDLPGCRPATASALD
jgi:hypothetical protein